MIRVKSVEPLGDFRLSLTFSDGTSGEVDLTSHLRGPIFEPLRNQQSFKKAFIDGGTVVWPNGADFAPEWLYALTHNLKEPNTVEQARENELEMGLRKVDKSK